MTGSSALPGSSPPRVGSRPRSGRGFAARRVGAQRGMTLVELLVTVTLVGLLTGTLVFGSGMLFGARQRAAAGLVVSAIRQGITHANSTGKPARLVFDLDSDRLSLEEGSGGPMLRVKEEGPSTGGGAEPATLAEKEAREEADRILKGPRAPRPAFTPVAGWVEEGDPTTGRELGAGVQFVQVETEHDGEPRQAGRAYLYFWPGGVTERAAIQLRRVGSEDGVTVMVHGLTGRARIEKGLSRLPRPRTDEEASEREDAP